MKVNLNAYYKKKPDIICWDTYWCKNWVFVPRERSNGDIYMVDTYFGDGSFKIKLTEDNLEDFEFIVDFRTIKKVRKEEFEKYNDKDKFFIATDSGGWEFGDRFWIKKEAEYDPELVVKGLNQKIADARAELDYLQNKKADFLNKIKEAKQNASNN
jgi:hypothetical protein